MESTQSEKDEQHIHTRSRSLAPHPPQPCATHTPVHLEAHSGHLIVSAGRHERVQRSTQEEDDEAAPVGSNAETDSIIRAPSGPSETLGAFPRDLPSNDSGLEWMPQLIEMGYERVTRPALASADWRIDFDHVTGGSSACQGL